MITSIETVDREIIEGQTDKAYVMYCKDTPFRPSDMIKGETLGATFTSGSLMGRDFELSINYKPETWKPEDGFDKKFEIIAQVESSGESQLIIPNESLHPEPGDTFVITGVKLPKERIEEAEKELLKAGESYAAKHSSDTDVYDCETNPVYCQENKKITMPASGSPCGSTLRRKRPIITHPGIRKKTNITNISPHIR